MRGADTARIRHVFCDGFGTVANFHRAAAEHITWSHQHRITYALGHANRIFRFERGSIRRAFYLQPVYQFAESLAVFSDIDHVRRRAEDGHAGGFELLCKLERRLSTEGDDHAIGLFKIKDVHHILEGERLEIKLIAGIVIGRDGFGIAVNHDSLESLLFERERGVDTAIIEFDSLPDAVRPAT